MFSAVFGVAECKSVGNTGDSSSSISNFKKH